MADKTVWSFLSPLYSAELVDRIDKELKIGGKGGVWCWEESEKGRGMERERESILLPGVMNPSNFSHI